MLQVPWNNILVPAWTSDEVMDEYEISKMTLNRWQNDGMPVIRLGRSVFYPVVETRSWVLENKINVPYGRKKYSSDTGIY
jgi:hypothetical protein